MPEVVYRLDELSRDPDCDMEEAAALVAADPPMAARVLKLANSAYFGAPKAEIATVRQAMTWLGLKEIRRLCLAIAVRRLFVRSSQLIDMSRLWNHSLTVALTTRTVAGFAPNCRIDLDEAYTAGLLHEIGSLVFDQYFNVLYTVVFREAERQHKPIQLLEEQYLKLTHAEIGALLLDRWRLPARLCECVAGHHSPEALPDEYRTLGSLVHVADYACTRVGNAGPGEMHRPILSAVAWNHLGIDSDVGPTLFDAITAEIERHAIFVSLAA